MSQSSTNINLTTCTVATQRIYDVVIVGTGVSAAIVAKELSENGYDVLMLEAGLVKDLTLTGFQQQIDTFYKAVDKNPNSPYPLSKNAFSPTKDNDYFVEEGPMRLGGSYTRVMGGTTMHWEAKTLRMLPEDFKLYSNYGHGLDWPIGYEDLEEFYCKAEREIGVCGDVEEQKSLGIPFIDNYVFPMYKLPPSYLDQKVAEKLNGTTVELDDQSFELGLTTFPQGRNGVPNPKYDEGKGFSPIGATTENPLDYGERCQGNANCVPLCPVQAKYDARRTISKAMRTGRVSILPQTVASQVEIDPENGRVTGIVYKHYDDPNSTEHTQGIVKGHLFVLAANAIENARLMLSSNLPSTSGMMGRHIMDHPFLLAWSLMPEVTGTMRGPLCTSGISAFRKGSFRSRQSAFGIDIHNDGWGWATGSPYTNILDIVDNKNMHGIELRKALIDQISRQLLLAVMCELPADPNNRVTVNRKHQDPLGNCLPIINFNISEYCFKTFEYARHLSRIIFQRLGAEDYTHYDPNDPAYFVYKNEGYFYRGGNHFSGSHVMGTSQNNSVVDAHLRSWDHQNLYLVGAGSMPSIGSSNTTLTLAALSFLASKEMLKDLKQK
jgi:choline dehydrogenase-like flavoprotein